MTIAIVAGLFVGFGAWLCWTGLYAPPESLAAVLGRIDQRAAPVAGPVPSDVDRDIRLGGFLLRSIPTLRRAVDSIAGDLRVVDRSPEIHAARVGSYVLLSLFLGPWIAFLSVVFRLPIPVFLAVAVPLVGTAWGLYAPFRSLRKEAAERRRVFIYALSAWCDVVVMTLAAGRGVEQAMETAASAGTGWAFAEIRGALKAGYVRGETPWDSLDRLGQELAIGDLSELARTIAMAGEEGAAVRGSVSAKARTLRERMTSDAELAAAGTTERMTLPSVLLVMGFVVFIAYPSLLQLFDISG